MVDNTERIIDDKDTEIGKLQLQFAKYKKGNDAYEAETTHVPNHTKSEELGIKRELEFQEFAWQQFSEQVRRAQTRTLEARFGNDGLLRCYAGSQGSVLVEEELTDEQAYVIIQQVIQDKKFVLVNGVHMYVSDAMQDIGKLQRQRGLDRFNAQVEIPLDERADAQGLAELSKETAHDHTIGKQACGGSPVGKVSQTGSTPPRQHPLSLNNRDGNDDNAWILSVMRGNGSNRDNGGGGGGGGGDVGGVAYLWATH